jgi:hypothetical protein
MAPREPRRIPADLRPNGDTRAWIEKLHRMKKEQPEKFAASSIGGTTYTIPGAAFLGMNATWEYYNPLPEEAALRTAPNPPDPGSAWEGTQWSIGNFPVPVPSKAVIGIPLPLTADPSPQGRQLHRGENVRHRYFILKVRKPNPDYTITGISVTAQAGAYSQVVLDNQAVSQSATDPLCGRIQTQGDVQYLEYLAALAGEDNFTLTEQGDEHDREVVRKHWTQGGWLPIAQPAPTSGAALIEYYRVRVTFDAAHPNNQILYGLINGQVVAPPSDKVMYQFKLHYHIGQLGATQTRDLPFAMVQVQWYTGQFFGDKYYPNLQQGWNYDKWADRTTFNWLSTQANRDLLEPVNDVSLEHGRNTGHGKGHLNGNNVDMFHPGYRSFNNTNQPGSGTTFRDSYLISYLQIARGDQTHPSITQAQATQVLAEWISQARARMYGAMTQAAVRFYGPDTFLYLSNSANSTSLDVRDCTQLRSLILDGHCNPYVVGGVTYQGLDLRSNPSLSPSQVLTSWGINDAKWTGPPDTSHTHHLHVNFAFKTTKFDSNSTVEGP